MNEQSRFQKNEYLFWINILDFYQNDYFLNRYFDFSLPMWLLPNVSNSSEIIQGSLVGPISVHFRVSITYTGSSGGLRSHIWALFWIFEWFSLFFWMNNSIEYSRLYWMIFFEWIFRILFWIESFLGPIQWKNEF